MAAEEPKPDAPELRLRATPRPVTRLKGALVVSLAVLFGALLVVLMVKGVHPFGPTTKSHERLPPVHPAQLPWMLADLPRSYAHIRHALAALSRPFTPTPVSREPMPPAVPLSLPEPTRAVLSPRARKRAAEAARALRAGVFFPRLAALKTQKPVHTRQNGSGVMWAPRSATRYALEAGTIIPASLITGLKSDLSGPVLAQITENVYDSISGAHLLLPQGARLIGSYDNHIAYGQSRVEVVFSRIILPNGASLALGHLPASDEAGYVGLSGGVDDHLFTLLKGAGVSSLLGIAAEQGLGLGNSLLAQALRQSVISTANQGGQELVHKSINVAPTITVPPGTTLTIVVQKTLMLPVFHG
jgi:type IV secretion system protein VirB10